ncbi:hypothetical protein ACFQPF_17550 [Fictibacillus iocasae]|uniref:Lipoprotein n=1 Tax=Fictibacillus iocasae TaxID=2715437 RepID=A0ABW2NZS5_9BACL
MKRLFKIGLLAFALMSTAACSEEVGKGSEKAVETKAIKDGHVVAVHLGNTFEEVAKGRVQLHNLDKLVQLEKKVEAKEQTEPVTITILNNKKEELAKNTLNYDGKVITFNNNYDGYRGSAKGTFTCEYMMIRGGAVYLESCKDQEEKEVTTVLAFMGTQKAFREAEAAN